MAVTVSELGRLEEVTETVELSDCVYVPLMVMGLDPPMVVCAARLAGSSEAATTTESSLKFNRANLCGNSARAETYISQTSGVSVAVRVLKTGEGLAREASAPFITQIHGGNFVVRKPRQAMEPTQRERTRRRK